MRLEIKVWLRVNLTNPQDACVIWPFAKTQAGYGEIYVDGKRVYAHRYVAQKFFGLEFSELKHVLHKCDKPSCVNWKHLFLGTQADNMKDAASKDRFIRKTHCVHGHAFTPDNVTIDSSNGGRYCKTCARRRASEHYLRGQD